MRYVSRPSPEDQWWKETKEEKGEKMEVNGDSLSENCDLPSSSGAGGSAAQSPATDESPTSEISNGLNIQVKNFKDKAPPHPSPLCKATFLSSFLFNCFKTLS